MATFPVRIDRGKPVPVYRQIADQLDSLLQSELYRDVQALPPVRVLAEQIGVNPNTVARAYRMLAREGRIQSRPGSGSFVGRLHGGAGNEGQWNRLTPHMRELIQEARTAGITCDTLVESIRQLWKSNDGSPPSGLSEAMVFAEPEDLDFID